MVSLKKKITLDHHHLSGSSTTMILQLLNIYDRTRWFTLNHQDDFLHISQLIILIAQGTSKSIIYTVTIRR